MMLLDPEFWRERRVLLTGHTGFKGAWAAMFLRELGAQVTGLGLEPSSEPSLFAEAELDRVLDHHIVDIRQAEAVHAVVRAARPQIVLHMAAQALVRRSYRDPLATFHTNVQGTVNLLDALRDCDSVETILVVTSDKVYENDNRGRAFDEGDALGGHDPYSASKAACEIVTRSYARCFFAPRDVPLATARGGNVIGGGDFSEDRIVPDIWRSVRAAKPLSLRNPQAVRPWQHVLDCLHGYLCYLQALQGQGKAPVPSALNIGPEPHEPVTVEALAQSFFAAMGTEPRIDYEEGEHPPEKALLSLDTSLARQSLGWRGLLSTREAVRWTAEWYGAFARGRSATELVREQMQEFLRREREA